MNVNTNSIQNLRDKIRHIQFGMLTNINNERILQSRPMTQQALDDDGTLWFFTSDETQLAKDLTNNSHINVSFSNPSDSVYVAISGDAKLVKNREKAKQLWNPMVAIWFPQGIDDPHMSLIKFSITYAEYWDSSTNKMMMLFAMAKAAITGEQPKNIAEHTKVKF